MEVLIVTSLLFGGVTALAANARGRDPMGWFIVGVFFAIFGLIAVLVMENLKDRSPSGGPRPISWRGGDDPN